MSTCRFAQRVSTISNHAIINEDVDPKLLIARLKKEVCSRMLFDFLDQRSQARAGPFERIWWRHHHHKFRGRTVGASCLSFSPMYPTKCFNLFPHPVQVSLFSIRIAVKAFCNDPSPEASLNLLSMSRITLAHRIFKDIISKGLGLLYLYSGLGLLYLYSGLGLWYLYSGLGLLYLYFPWLLLDHRSLIIPRRIFSGRSRGRD